MAACSPDDQAGVQATEAKQIPRCSTGCQLGVYVRRGFGSCEAVHPLKMWPLRERAAQRRPNTSHYGGLAAGRHLAFTAETTPCLHL